MTMISTRQTEQVSSVGRHKSHRGFTLLEILIAITLLIIGCVSIFECFGIGIVSESDLAQSTIALNLANEKMEEIRNASSYSAVDSFTSPRSALSGDFVSFDREVTIDSNPKQVNVIVYWNLKGEEQNINLVTLFADYDY